jgi:hypothetical protein
VFEDQGRRGFFDGEPDFAVALDAYRQAVAEKPDATRVPGEWWWLCEMVERVSHGRPGVTEGEFIELAAWFATNEGRMEELVDVGAGRRVGRTNLRCGVKKGPRALGATRVVEDLRGLRAV